MDKVNNNSFAFSNPIARQNVKVDGFLVLVYGRCKCGEPRAMVVPLTPDGGGYECGRCGIVWTVSNLEIDTTTTPRRTNIKLGAAVPAIVRPGT
jgi:hypothetical protein